MLYHFGWIHTEKPHLINNAFSHLAFHNSRSHQLEVYFFRFQTIGKSIVVAFSASIVTRKSSDVHAGHAANRDDPTFLPPFLELGQQSLSHFGDDLTIDCANRFNLFISQIMETIHEIVHPDIINQ